MNEIPATPSRRILPAIGKLLRMRLLISFNSFKHARTRTKVLTILAGLGVLFLIGMILFLSLLLLDFLNSPQLKQYAGLAFTPFLHMMPVLIFTSLFLGILFTGFGVLLQSLYLSGDMDFLLSSPVPIRAVFVTKLLQAVLPNFCLILLFGLPVLFGLGISSHYSILYYPLVILVMIAITLAAAGLSALLVMLVVRILPPRRAVEILGFVGAILAFSCSQAGNLYNAFGHSTDLSGQQINSLFTLLVRFNNPWFPLNWAGLGVVALGEGRWLASLPLLALTLAGCGLAFTFALTTAERWYYSGWAGMQAVASRKKQIRSSHPDSGSNRVSWLGHLIPAPVRGIVWKDFLLLRRDLRNLSQLITPLIFGVIYSLMFLSPRSQLNSVAPDMPPWFGEIMHVVTTYGSIGMSLFVGWWLLGRLSGMAFSSEGKNYWLLKSAPVRTRYLLLGKYLVAYLPTLVLGLLFLVGIGLLQRIPLTAFLYGLLIMVMCLAGVNGILLTFGVIGANFKWEDPRRMNAGAFGCLGSILTVLFLPLAFGMFVGPLLLVPVFHIQQVYGYLVGLIAGCGISLVSAILPPWLVQKKVERLGEE